MAVNGGGSQVMAMNMNIVVSITTPYNHGGYVVVSITSLYHNMEYGIWNIMGSSFL